MNCLWLNQWNSICFFLRKIKKLKKNRKSVKRKINLSYQITVSHNKKHRWFLKIYLHVIQSVKRVYLKHPSPFFKTHNPPFSNVMMKISNQLGLQKINKNIIRWKKRIFKTNQTKNFMIWFWISQITIFSLLMKKN